MSTFQINDEQLKQVYEEILSDLQKLSKAEEEKEDKKEKEDKEKEKEMPETHEKADELHQESEDSDEKLHDVLEDEEGEGEGEETYSFEELKEDYANLPLETLKLHYLAAKEAIAHKMGEKTEADEEMMHKSQKKAVKKSEASVEKAKLQKMEKQMSLMQKSLEKIVSLPLGRKAITEASALQKNETAPKQLSKSEVMSKLRSLAASPTLAKSDRELINQFCLGTIELSKVTHLLDK